jgi:hypothetical protein
MHSSIIYVMRQAEACQAWVDWLRGFASLQDAWDACSDPGFMIWYLCISGGISPDVDNAIRVSNERRESLKTFYPKGVSALDMDILTAMTIYETVESYLSSKLVADIRAAVPTIPSFKRFRQRLSMGKSLK